jgi:hypothetical protein
VDQSNSIINQPKAPLQDTIRPVRSQQSTTSSTGTPISNNSTARGNTPQKDWTSTKRSTDPRTREGEQPYVSVTESRKYHRESDKRIDTASPKRISKSTRKTFEEDDGNVILSIIISLFISSFISSQFLILILLSLSSSLSCCVLINFIRRSVH